MMLNGNLCRTQANECLLLAIEKPEDAMAIWLRKSKPQSQARQETAMIAVPRNGRRPHSATR
jgi:hypothetical protein